MIPTRGRCLAMTAGAIALAGALLLAGMPGAILLALTPGLLCLAMAFVMGHGDPHGEELVRTAGLASASPAETAHRRRASGPVRYPQESLIK